MTGSRSFLRLVPFGNPSRVIQTNDRQTVRWLCRWSRFHFCASSSISWRSSRSFFRPYGRLGPADFYNREEWNAGFRNYSDCVSAASGMSAEWRRSRRSKPQGRTMVTVVPISSPPAPGGGGGGRSAHCDYTPRRGLVRFATSRESHEGPCLVHFGLVFCCLF